MAERPTLPIEALNVRRGTREPRAVEVPAVGHDEAEAILHRFCNSHFGSGERARVSVPADPLRDDDVRLLAYIAQQRRADDERPPASTERGEDPIEGHDPLPSDDRRRRRGRR